MAASLKVRYRKAQQDNNVRMVVVVLAEELDAIDRWGIPAGMPSRTSAVRFLLRKALDSKNLRMTGNTRSIREAGPCPGKRPRHPRYVPANPGGAIRHAKEHKT